MQLRNGGGDLAADGAEEDVVDAVHLATEVAGWGFCLPYPCQSVSSGQYVLDHLE